MRQTVMQLVCKGHNRSKTTASLFVGHRAYERDGASGGGACERDGAQPVPEKASDDHAAVFHTELSYVIEETASKRSGRSTSALLNDDNRDDSLDDDDEDGRVQWRPSSIAGNTEQSYTVRE
ncbi:hypothetical protein EVAR_60216_1 [Eumeta japonica]|uniref:Uncharacterized protein n=1 Tax=Eumeta variegata TaxID=151549 RepID=A0A4C1ZA99_EUMVA|nr:hypothetical protein EVAR_60216_1 [Eumeta japonica]